MSGAFALIIAFFIFHVKQKYSNIMKTEILVADKIVQLPPEVQFLSLIWIFISFPL